MVVRSYEAVPATEDGEKLTTCRPRRLVLVLCISAAFIIPLLLTALHRAGVFGLPHTEQDADSLIERNVCNLPVATTHTTNKGISLSDMPKKGYGTCCRPTANGDALLNSTLEYISYGGRLIDTAVMYGNHKTIGEALLTSSVPRDQLWVTTKVQAYQVGRIPGGIEEKSQMPGLYKGSEILAESSTEDIKRRTLNLIKTALSELCLEYLDLVLIHNPTGIQGADTKVWSALIEAKKIGLVKHIGLSNFGKESIEKFRAMDASYPPEVLQTYYFPASPPEQKEFVAWCIAQGMRFTAIGSLGGSKYRLGSGEKPVLPFVQELSKRHNATVGQILLRWALDQGLDVIPGSYNHIKENLDLDFFHLSAAEIANITKEARQEGKPWYEQR